MTKGAGPVIVATSIHQVSPQINRAVAIAESRPRYEGIAEHGCARRASGAGVRAHDMFYYAASYYGDRDAQYRLGCMYLDGQGVGNQLLDDVVVQAMDPARAAGACVPVQQAARSGRAPCLRRGECNEALRWWCSCELRGGR